MLEQTTYIILTFSPLHPSTLCPWKNPHPIVPWCESAPFSGALQLRFSSAWREQSAHTGLINFSCLSNYSPEVTMKAKQINLCFTEILISHGALTKKKKKWPETELAPEQQATKVALKLLNFYAGGRWNLVHNFFYFFFFPNQSVATVTLLKI